MKVRLKHIHRVKRFVAGEWIEYHSIRDKPGSRFWKTGDCPVGSEEYIERYHEARAQKPAQTATPTRQKQRLFEDVIAGFIASPNYTNLAPRTRTDYFRWLERFRAKFGKAPVAAMQANNMRHVARQWRDKNWSGRPAKYCWTVLNIVVNWTIEERYMTKNVFAGGGSKLYRPKRAELVWTTEEVERILDVSPPWLRRAITLMAETGFRPGDLVQLTRLHVFPTPRGRRITKKTQKSNQTRIASVPVTDRAATVIDTTPPGQKTLLVNEHGQSLTEEWLSKAVTKHRRKAGLRDELVLYNFRGTAATRLLRAGATLEQLASHFGWSRSTAAKMLDFYAA